MYIILDFDGTVVEHKYPRIGKPNPLAIETIQKIQKAGHKIILNTYRADCNDGTLYEAIEYLRKHGIEVDKCNKRKIAPPDWNWNYFKARGIIYIDDICKGTPLRSSADMLSEMVDWNAVSKELYNNIII